MIVNNMKEEEMIGNNMKSIFVRTKRLVDFEYSITFNESTKVVTIVEVISVKSNSYCEEIHNRHFSLLSFEAFKNLAKMDVNLEDIPEYVHKQIKKFFTKKSLINISI